MRLDAFDEFFYLMGDEDTDVGLHCLKCDRGGLPVVLYHAIQSEPVYKNTDVVQVSTITDFMANGMAHITKHRSE